MSNVESTPVCLTFDAKTSAVVQARIRYAFKVFAAVYGYSVVSDTSAKGAVCLHYGGAIADGSPAYHVLTVPALYQLRPLTEPPPSLSPHRYANESFPLFFGVDPQTGHPDWLGEIFEWLSSSHELSISNRDSIGRIPFCETVFAKQGLSARRPYATMMMSWLAGALRKDTDGQPLSKPRSPAAGGEHLLVSSHDIDFYYTARLPAIIRLLKNLVIAFHLYRSWDFFLWNASKILRLLSGGRVAAYLPALLEASRSGGFQSTVFVVSSCRHRRDPNYTLQHLIPELRTCCESGFSIGVHGSYQSIIEARDLKPEVSTIFEALGVRPLGGRQHWLRFRHHETLFQTVEEAGLLFDSTLGFADTVGFRNGASFAFPPYDFKNECAHEFLEIPLVLMDGSLEVVCRSTGEQPDAVAGEVLRASQEWGWGGIAIDWHNPLEPIQVPAKINDAFWKCLESKASRDERWISGNQFLELCIGRYQAAGLLRGVRLDA